MQRAHFQLQRAIGGLPLLQLVGSGGAQCTPGKKETNGQPKIQDHQQRDDGKVQVENGEQLANRLHCATAFLAGRGLAAVAVLGSFAGFGVLVFLGSLAAFSGSTGSGLYSASKSKLTF